MQIDHLIFYKINIKHELILSYVSSLQSKTSWKMSATVQTTQHSAPMCTVFIIGHRVYIISTRILELQNRRKESVKQVIRSPDEYGSWANNGGAPIGALRCHVIGGYVVQIWIFFIKSTRSVRARTHTLKLLYRIAENVEIQDNSKMVRSHTQQCNRIRKFKEID